MAICYYVSSHGLGHAVRASAVINAVAENVPVIVRSEAPAEIFDQELRRPAVLTSARFDCGAIQTDPLGADAEKTLETYARIHESNQRRLGAEIDFLNEHEVRVVATDVPSFPLKAAREAGVPGVLIGNFTWADIYEPYAARLPRFAPLLEAMRSEYRCTDLCLRLAFSLPMDLFARSLDIGLICRPISPVREALAREYGLDPHCRWVLVYLGQWPSRFDWRRLARVPNTEFLRLGGRDEDGIPVRSVDARRFGGQNVVAACDAVIAKPGYGIAADCVAGNTPLLYAERKDFAEFEALHRDLQAWGRATLLDDEAFHRGDLAGPLEQATRRPVRRQFATDGAPAAAGILVDAWRA